MPREIKTITAQGFTCPIIEGDDKIVRFTADADIDADGANGQSAAILAAYRVGDGGLEYLKNGGLRMQGGLVVPNADWWKDIFIPNSRGDGPMIFPGGVLGSKTAYRYPNSNPGDPHAYVDAAVIPYVCVPPCIIDGVVGAVLGCAVRATHTITKLAVDCVCCDVGPRNRVGEVSIMAGKLLGLNSSPRYGGTDKPVILYEVMPGRPAVINGQRFTLQHS